MVTAIRFNRYCTKFIPICSLPKWCHFEVVPVLSGNPISYPLSYLSLVKLPVPTGDCKKTKFEFKLLVISWLFLIAFNECGELLYSTLNLFEKCVENSTYQLVTLSCNFISYQKQQDGHNMQMKDFKHCQTSKVISKVKISYFSINVKLINHWHILTEVCLTCVKSCIGYRCFTYNKKFKFDL